MQAGVLIVLINYILPLSTITLLLTELMILFKQIGNSNLLEYT